MSSRLPSLQTGAYQEENAPRVGSSHMYSEISGQQTYTLDYIRVWGLDIVPDAGASPFIFASTNFDANEKRLINVSGNWFKWIGYGDGTQYGVGFRFYRLGSLVSDWLGLSAVVSGVLGIDEKFLVEFDAVEIWNLRPNQVGISFNYGRAAALASIRQ